MEDVQREKKTPMGEGAKTGVIALIMIGLTLAYLVIAWNVHDRKYPSGTPDNKGQTTSVGALKLPLPDGWRITHAANSVTYAEPPNSGCSDKEPTCKTVAVHDMTTFKGGNWQALTANYNCPTNQAESSQKASDAKVVDIGNGANKISAFKRTIDLCSVSHGATLTVFEVQVSPTGPYLILAKTNGKNAIPDIEQRLKNATLG
jgi:hypothetical protein